MSNRERFRVPIIDHGDEKALEYVKRHFDEQRNTARRQAMIRMAWNTWMDLGNHWVQPALMKKSGSGIYHFEQTWRNGNKKLPRPVDNMIGEGVKNLTDRITRKQYEPLCKPGGRNPELEAAARLRQDIVRHEQKQAEWLTEIDRPLVNDIVLCGPGFGHVYWDETLTDTMRIAATEAQACGKCQSKLSSNTLAMGDLMTWAGKGGPFPMYEGPNPDIERVMRRGTVVDKKLTLSACPHCDEPMEGSLTSYNPTEDEAKSGTDYFGRPLGSDVAKGKLVWEIVPAFDMWPENGGFIDPRKCRIWGHAHVESMEWVEARVPADKMAEITPDEPHELLKHHPTLGFQAIKGRTTTDENTFSNHVRVLDITVEPMEIGGEGPSDGLRWGRFIRVMKDIVIRNEALERPVPNSESGRRQAISKFYCAGAKSVRGSMWYRTPVDDARPLNILLNRKLARQEDIEDRGIPIVAIPEGIEWEAVNDTATGAFREHKYNGTAAEGLGGWRPKDAIVNPNSGASAQQQPTIDDVRDRIRNILGPMPIEAGEAGGAESAIQAQLQAEQAAQKLNQIDQARVSIEEGMLQTGADMLWAFRREGGEYERENEIGEYETKSYEGTELIGEAKVSLEAKGTSDESLLQAEKAAQAQGDGLYGDPALFDQETRDDLLELRGLPKLNNVQSIQVKTAKAAWAAFINEQQVPYVDTTIQDTWIWYQVLGKLWQGDEAKKIQRAVGWENVLRKLAGWERKLTVSEAQDHAQRGLYEGQPPERWAQIEAEFNAKAAAVSESATEMAGAMGAPAPPPQVAPPPPPGGKFLPEALCDRILMLWRAMLGVPAGVAPDGVTPVPGQPLPDLYNMDPASKERLKLIDPAKFASAEQLDTVLRMYAVIQECRLDSMKKQGAIPAAPGGGSTPTGGVPTPGSAVAPAVGVEQAVRGAA